MIGEWHGIFTVDTDKKEYYDVSHSDTTKLNSIVVSTESNNFITGTYNGFPLVGMHIGNIVRFSSTSQSGDTTIFDGIVVSDGLVISTEFVTGEDGDTKVYKCSYSPTGEELRIPSSSNDISGHWTSAEGDSVIYDGDVVSTGPWDLDIQMYSDMITGTMTSPSGETVELNGAAFDAVSFIGGLLYGSDSKRWHMEYRDGSLHLSSVEACEIDASVELRSFTKTGDSPNDPNVPLELNGTEWTADTTSLITIHGSVVVEHDSVMVITGQHKNLISGTYTINGMTTEFSGYMRTGSENQLVLCNENWAAPLFATVEDDKMVLTGLIVGTTENMVLMIELQRR